MDLAEIRKVYDGSNGAATQALYARLYEKGPRGIVAVNIFRAAKTSERAKKYRGGNKRGSFRAQAYSTKEWAMSNLCIVLLKEGAALGIRFGWGRDARTIGFENVLYIDLPTGQVSYHTRRRGDGADYPGTWDGARGHTADRICRYCEAVLAGRELAPLPLPEAPVEVSATPPPPEVPAAPDFLLGGRRCKPSLPSEPFLFPEFEPRGTNDR